jgi:hypothetical protein
MIEQLFPVHYYEDLPSWVVEYLEPTLWWVAVVIIFSLDFFFYTHFKKTQLAKKFLFGLVIFATFFGAARAIENVRKFYFADNRINIGLWWIGQGPALTGLELWLRVSYYVLSWIAIAIFYYVTETQVFQRKTKYIFTFSAIWEGVVSIAMYFSQGSLRVVFLIFSVIGFFIAGIGFIGLYLIVAIRSSGDIQKSAYLTSIGMTFFVIGVMAELPQSFLVVWLTSGQFLDAWLIAVLAPISMLVAGFFLYLGYKKMFSWLG